MRRHELCCEFTWKNVNLASLLTSSGQVKRLDHRLSLLAVFPLFRLVFAVLVVLDEVFRFKDESDVEDVDLVDDDGGSIGVDDG